MQYRWIAIFSLVVVLACDGKQRSNTGDPLLDSFLDVPEIELVNFSLQGTATCGSCTDDGAAGMTIDVVPVNDPTTTIASGVFMGMGSFSFTGLRYRKGVELNVYGTLYVSGEAGGSVPVQAETMVIVPSDDNAVVAFTINFP
ncbi:MAG: hypothetical protein HY465_05365 [Deltaproteobacteria bacterium]|nr:hypothetical protein [Deltaproteobacteria bacterium]